jgi:hypothetical protein
MIGLKESVWQAILPVLGLREEYRETEAKRDLDKWAENFIRELQEYLCDDMPLSRIQELADMGETYQGVVMKVLKFLKGQEMET